MDKDYYRIMGVDELATKPVIKAAYYSLVKKHHPDLGGDPELFKLIGEAYTVLSDPELRTEYDQTGQIDDTHPEKIMADVLQLFEQAINDFLDQAGTGMGQHDFITLLNTQLKQERQKREATISAQNQKVRDIGNFRKRCKRNDEEENVFVDACDKKIKSIKDGISEDAKYIKVFDRAIDELGNYSSPVEMVRGFQGFMSSSTVTSTDTQGQTVTVVIPHG